MSENIVGKMAVNFGIGLAKLAIACIFVSVVSSTIDLVHEHVDVNVKFK